MLDIGGAELLVIAVVALVVLGPKELPTAVRTVQGFVRKAREMAREFQNGLGEMAREIELDKMKSEVKSAFETADVDKIGHTIRQEFEQASAELKKTVDPGALTAPPTDAAIAPAEPEGPPPPEPPPAVIEPAPPEPVPAGLSSTAPSPKPGA